MKISYRWLKSLLDFKKNPADIATLLTQVGLEVSATHSFQFIPPQLILGRILTSIPHPHADKLKKTTVDIGQPTPLNIVCGAPNATEGKKVVVAPIGTTLSLPNGRALRIKKATIRGEVSEGMLCAADEIGVGDEHEQIIQVNGKHMPGTALTMVWNTPEDTIFDIELTPNRSDALSHLGVARDIAAALHKSLPQNAIIKPVIPCDNAFIQVQVRNKKACSRYTCVVISDIVLQPSPMWLQSYLRAVGMRPVNNIVDITNFIMHDLGQPLHAFDYDQLHKKKITLKCFPAGTSFLGLDGVTRELNGQELMVCNGEIPIAMAGIIGGESTKITSSTTCILLESAYFDPGTIAQAAKYHQIDTQSAFRFARGTDPDMPYVALQKAARLIQKYAKGTIASTLQDYHQEEEPRTTITFSHDYITRIIGHEIRLDVVQQILEGLGITLQNGGDDLIATIPPYRRDVQRPIDLVEEIVRIYGYDNIEVDQKPSFSIKTSSTIPSTPSRQSLKTWLAAQGYHEMITNALTKETHAMLSSSNILLANPLSENLNSLRQTLLFSGLEVLQHNQNHQQSVLRFFEIGKVYIHGKETYDEQERLGIWLAGKKAEAHWSHQQDTGNQLVDLRTLVEDMLFHSHISHLTITTIQHPHYEQAIALQQGDSTYGYLGCVRSTILERFGLQGPVFFATLDLQPLLVKNGMATYQPIPKYPKVNRDLSLIIPEGVTFAQIQQTIDQAAIPCLQEVRLIDCYHSSSLGSGKKGYTLRCSLQSFKKTLQEPQINRVMEQLACVLTQDIKAIIRD